MSCPVRKSYTTNQKLTQENINLQKTSASQNEQIQNLTSQLDKQSTFDNIKNYTCELLKEAFVATCNNTFDYVSGYQNQDNQTSMQIQAPTNTSFCQEQQNDQNIDHISLEPYVFASILVGTSVVAGVAGHFAAPLWGAIKNRFWGKGEEHLISTAEYQVPLQDDYDPEQNENLGQNLHRRDNNTVSALIKLD